MNLSKFILVFLSCICLGNIAFCQFQDNVASNEPVNETSISQKKKLNFFIVSKRHKGKFDPATRFNVFRTKLKSMLRQKKFVAIVARDAEQASVKMQYRLEKYNARIGTIWFDSHGKYIKGYSLFFIGHDEYNYKTLKDSLWISPLKELAAFSDGETKIVIGSCYGGATYERPSVDYKDTTRMNGDSLMIGMGKIFNQSSIYACESWVMSKPGLFLKRAAVAGYPGRKLFRDVCYQPAWENMGKWNEYNAATDNFASINPVTLDTYGNLMLRTASYPLKEETRKRIINNLSKLKPGLYK